MEAPVEELWKAEKAVKSKFYIYFKYKKRTGWKQIKNDDKQP